MQLLIDIGNTNTSIALSNGGKIKKRYFIYTAKKAVEPGALKRLFGRDLVRIEKIIIVSVVPKFHSIVKKSLKTILPGAVILTVGKNVKVPMKVKVKTPKEVGQDRLVASYAASEVYGAPLIVVDFGTAVTFDLVNKKREYEGGLIYPGIRLAMEALSRNAALLPKIDLKSSRSLIGKDTVSSMNNGILYGYASMCDGIIELIRKKRGKRIKIVTTGGNAGLIARFSKHLENIRPDLVFEGLSFLAREAK